MLKTVRVHLIALLALGCAAPVFAQADPTVHQVYEAANSGHLDQAQQMITQVLRDHPESSKAHYVAAEIYAREGHFQAAQQELGKAETLQPGLPAENPQSVAKLRREIALGQGVRTAPRYSSGNSVTHATIPWAFILIVLGVVAVLWAIMRRRATTAAYHQYPGGAVASAGGGPGYPPPGYGPGYGPGPGMGSGIAGGLASGLAVGAGVVAGEELAHRFLDRDGNVLPAADPNQIPQNPDMGGSDFGVSDPGSWDDGGGSFGGDLGGGGGGDDWS